MSYVVVTITVIYINHRVHLSHRTVLTPLNHLHHPDKISVSGLEALAGTNNRYNYNEEMILTLQISENQPWLPIINWETPSLPLASPAVVDKISVKISYWCHDQITKNFSIHVAALPFSNGAWRVILKYFLLSKFYQTPDYEDGEGGAYLNKRYSSNLTCIFETDGELFTTKTRSTIC